MAKKKTKKKGGKKRKKRATAVEQTERKLRALKHIETAQRAIKDAKEVLHGPKVVENTLGTASKALDRATTRLC